MLINWSYQFKTMSDITKNNLGLFIDRLRVALIILHVLPLRLDRLKSINYAKTFVVKTSF
ncbi:hypothetical protein AXX16_2859 [Serratia rubidaea]|nr:hypothetical protein AXX16_2859 [Serratia rubidaea]